MKPHPFNCIVTNKVIYIFTLYSNYTFSNKRITIRVTIPKIIKTLIVESKSVTITMQPELPVEFFIASIGQNFTVLVAPVGALKIQHKNEKKSLSVL